MGTMSSAFRPEQLLDPAAYAHVPRRVTLVETHISWVFLADDLVFKVKKPVDFGFLDYSTLARRKHWCEEEVRLNRRLCPDAYLGVEPIVEQSGTLRVGIPGVAIEYAVVMRRLPAGRMLDHLLRVGEVTESLIGRVAKRVAEFHATARQGPEIDQFGTPTAIRLNWDENFEQIQPYVGRTISAAHLATIRAFTEGYLDRRADIFARRLVQRRIRDCHGDMRSESICVTDGLCIFDCIEFSDRLRCGDTASELAFLAMDIDARGRPDLAYWLVDRYIASSGDQELRAVLRFYACYRAFVRGKVQSFRLDQPVARQSAHRTAQRRARHYLQLAWSYARAPDRPLLVLVRGLSGTGKTTLARALAMRLGGEVISSDRVRKELSGLETSARPSSAYGEGIYSPAMSQRTYVRMLELAAESLELGHTAVLDATFRARDERAAALALAKAAGVDHWIVECTLPEAEILRRIRDRVASGEGASDADAAVYLAQRASVERVDPSEGPQVRLDTRGAIASVTRRALEPILRSVPRI